MSERVQQIDSLEYVSDEEDSRVRASSRQKEDPRFASLLDDPAANTSDTTKSLNSPPSLAAASRWNIIKAYRRDIRGRAADTLGPPPLPQGARQNIARRPKSATSLGSGWPRELGSGG
ncbi:hypothetical protein QAD02_021943 [Eretmocerus hayati]|uniref:Uncharacterized protein n=1 Tax=Eretmocerus hayati TaxID=131215 RepID=A0ACC2PU52_9HYME|nr:hypothetical protein QAD02_021943 [Eretmocerus hayati]